jgi:hypothetical protein
MTKYLLPIPDETRYTDYYDPVTIGKECSEMSNDSYGTASYADVRTPPEIRPQAYYTRYRSRNTRSNTLR